jgi:hypothetical protein
MHQVQEEASDYHPGTARLPLPGLRDRIGVV